MSSRSAESSPFHGALTSAKTQISSSQQQTTTTTTPPPHHKSKLNDRLVRDAIAGACAGALAKTAVAPIERVKLLLQLRGSADVKGTTAWEVMKRVYRDQGILAFWRGNTPNVIRQGGTAALNFMLMDTYKSAITPLLNYTLSYPSHRTPAQRRKRRKFFSSFMSGGLAGGTTTTILYPIEFMRTRLAMDLGSSFKNRLYPRGMRDVFCGIWNKDGFKGLYQGYGIALAGVVVYRALHLGGYDAVKTELMSRKSLHSSNESITMTERFATAQIVSIVAGTICYPIDSVRRRLMMQAGKSVREYTNSMDCFGKVWRKEGLRGFYLGIGPNLVRSFGGALLLVAYDLFKGVIH